MYKLSAYYLAKMAADLPTELLNVVLYTVVAYWFGGLRHTAAAFVGLLLLMALVTAVAESWGLLIGVVFMDPKNAQVSDSLACIYLSSIELYIAIIHNSCVDSSAVSHVIECCLPIGGLIAARLEIYSVVTALQTSC